MSVLVFIILAIVLVMIAAAALIMFNSMRMRGAVARSLDMVLLSFMLPRFAPPAGGGAGDDKKLIAVMEQLYASIATLSTKGWNKFLYGNPYIALEMAVHHIGEQIHFYIAVPSAFADNFEKQVQGMFPNAQVQRSSDYNIFNPSGVSAGGYLVCASLYSGGASFQFELDAYINGSRARAFASSAGATTATGCTVVRLNANDYLEIWSYNAGATLSIAPNGVWNYLTIDKIN